VSEQSVKAPISSAIAAMPKQPKPANMAGLQRNCHWVLGHERWDDRIAFSSVFAKIIIYQEFWRTKPYLTTPWFGYYLWCHTYWINLYLWCHPRWPGQAVQTLIVMDPKSKLSPIKMSR